jgi:hypothetical protein
MANWQQQYTGQTVSFKLVAWHRLIYTVMMVVTSTRGPPVNALNLRQMNSLACPNIKTTMATNTCFIVEQMPPASLPLWCGCVTQVTGAHILTFSCGQPIQAKGLLVKQTGKQQEP